MPMFHFAFRFPDAAITADEFMRQLESEVGRRGARHIEDLQIGGQSLSFTSMNFIMLIYGAKVCLANGAVCVDIVNQRERPLVLPPWTARRWIDIGLLRRIRIWIGPISLKSEPP